MDLLLEVKETELVRVAGCCQAVAVVPVDRFRLPAREYHRRHIYDLGLGVQAPNSNCQVLGARGYNLGFQLVNRKLSDCSRVRGLQLLQFNWVLLLILAPWR